MRHGEDFNSFFGVFKKAANPIKLVGKPTLQGGRKSQIILSYKLLLATEDLRAMLITQKQSTTISNQFVFKLLMQSSVPSMINLNRLKKLMNAETLDLKTNNEADWSKKLKVLETDFTGDFNHIQIGSELHLILAFFKNSKPVDFCEICKTFLRHGWRKTSNDIESLDHRTNSADKWCDINHTQRLFINAEQNQNLA